MVRKNLSAHSRRNIKTAIMFTTSLAFIIFAGSSFSLQAHSLGSTISLGTGSDILVLALRKPLDEMPIRSFLEQKLSEKNPTITGFTFVTFPMAFNKWMGLDSMSNLAGYPSVPVQLHGVEENYLNNTFANFFKYAEVDTFNNFNYQKTSNNKYDVIKSLYVDAGNATLPIESKGIHVPDPVISVESEEERRGMKEKLTNAYVKYVDVVCSEALRYTISVDTKTPMKLFVNVKDSGRINYLVKSRAMLNGLPGFAFSSYRHLAILSPVLVTMDTYYDIMKEGWDAKRRDGEVMPERPPKQYLRIKMKSGSSTTDRDIIMNGVRNYLKDDTTQILNTQDMLDSTQIAVRLLDVFFYIVSVISVVLCFLVLWLSFTANVNENAWEFGVLRAIGLTSATVIRMYVYEALCLILSSVFIGSTIGMAVSVTLTMQFNVFTELPFSFDFPYFLFFSVLAMSIAVAIGGSYLPASAIKKKDIAIALKNL